ncbi:MAG: serine O-acetyltransferase [Eubacteriales bacterium]|nr:serine O-acetyltransferase [Eubacteriales bacterium]
MFKKTRGNINAVMEKDPAARNGFEVFLCCPGVWALMWHTTARWCYCHNLKLIGRIISQLTRWVTGIEIHPGAVIGNRCFIDHGMSVVIGETTEIGDDCTIYQGVTLGGTGKDTGKRHPTIGDRVIVSSGAKGLGPINIGSDVKIGAGSVVLRDVPDGCTVVGIPGTVVRQYGHSTEDMDQLDMPDPVAVELECLRRRVVELEELIVREYGHEAIKRCGKEWQYDEIVSEINNQVYEEHHGGHDCANCKDEDCALRDVDLLMEQFNDEKPD